MLLQNMSATFYYKPSNNDIMIRIITIIIDQFSKLSRSDSNDVYARVRVFVVFVVRVFL